MIQCFSQIIAFHNVHREREKKKRSAKKAEIGHKFIYLDSRLTECLSAKKLASTQQHTLVCSTHHIITYGEYYYTKKNGFRWNLFLKYSIKTMSMFE